MGFWERRKWARGLFILRGVVQNLIHERAHGSAVIGKALLLWVSSALLQLFHVWAVTICAALRSRRIEEDLFAVDVAEQFVAARAGYVSVLSLERELSSLVMIKKRWLPLGSVVAIPARSDLIFVQLSKLSAVNVFVAFFALLWGLLEVHVQHARFKIGWFVAINTGDRAVGADQREGGGPVIEAIQLTPGLCVMAGFAPHRLAVGTCLGHALLELPVMRVIVAGRA